MRLDIGKNIEMDLSTLVDTRLLIQANSGGGKSWAIRKVLESTHGKVHQIVLDIEGDFPSLREKFDFILAGKGGDIPANPKTAELLARKILELRSDIIIDLYELKQHERIRFVRLFLDAMINAPKDLWHPALVVVDEAHIFAPEKGQAESMGAVIDLCTRGRKRGYCAVLATQRLSKLHKDAAAECNNKLIGRTGLDIDLKRAGDELGLGSKDATMLRHLEPGQFYAFGPAISREVIKCEIGSVKTSHPKAGSRQLGHAPEPTAKVKSVLQKLVDLPKEAEEELTDRTALRSRVKELERQAKQSKSDPEVEQKAYERGKIEGEKYNRVLVDRLQRLIQKAWTGTAKLHELLESEGASEGVPKQYFPPEKPKYAPEYKPAPIRASVLPNADGKEFGQCERRILGFLKMKEGHSFSKAQVGAMTGYSHGSGGFNNAISKLSQAGLIVRRGADLELNSEANGQIDEIVGNETPHRLEDWINKLGACERSIYQKLLEDPDQCFDKERLGSETGYSSGSGGFNNALSRLKTLGLIKKDTDGISLNPEVSEL